MIPVIGLTGVIGSGKSRVAEEFRNQCCYVIDADQQAREILERPSTLKIIQRWWGPSVVSEGKPNRRAIADVIFKNPVQKLQFEQFIYSIMDVEREILIEHARRTPEVVAVVIDAPLLIEANVHKECDAVIVVSCSDEHRHARIQNRGWTADQLKRREDCQLSPEEKLAFADYVIENDGLAEDISPQVQSIIDQILRERHRD